MKPRWRQSSLGRMLVIVFVMLFGSLISVHAQPELVAKFIVRAHTYNGVTLPYRLFIPEAYDPNRKYPVVLALHGSGQRIMDSVVFLTSGSLATVWAEPANQAQHPCFVVVPQCSSDDWWGSQDRTMNPTLETANNIIDSLGREFSVDTDRLYVTGLSMGGYGTWTLVTAFPDRFAAAVPVAGGGLPASAAKLLTLPIWDFHGAIDPAVPVQESRSMIGALAALGRPVVYTHCHNRDYTGLPDSVIRMQVQSHECLLYTEFQDGAHDMPFFNRTYHYPYLIQWVFDKHKLHSGAIHLTSLQSHITLAGTSTITWSTNVPGDSVELWFSPDAGTCWRLVSHSVPNTGSYLWNTVTAGDCSFGQIKIFQKDSSGHVFSEDRSGYFSINNTGQPPPLVKIVGDEFTTATIFDKDSIDLHMLIGGPVASPLPAVFSYSPDGGSNFVRFDSAAVRSDTTVQTCGVRVAALANSDQGVVRVAVSAGALTATTQTSPFIKRTVRRSSLKAEHASGIGGATVAVHVIDHAALTGHRYRLTFNDVLPGQKRFSVRDLARNVEVIHDATELDGITESSLFDGLRLLIYDPPSVRVDQDSSRWVKGKTTLLVQASVTPRDFGSGDVIPYAAPYDYRLTIFPAVVDTSKEAYVFTAIPIKFRVWNLTKDRKTDVLFYDADGNQTISSLDELDLLELDSLGLPRLSWGMLFVPDTANIAPAPGDQFELRTLKPLTSADVYEFVGEVNTVPGSALLPSRFVLEQNYPNPFNPATTIRYTLPHRSHVRLAVFNLLGQLVTTLLNADINAGTHEVQFNGRNLASGVYFYRLQAGSFTETKRLVIVK